MDTPGKKTPNPLRHFFHAQIRHRVRLKICHVELAAVWYGSYCDCDQLNVKSILHMVC